METYKGYEIYFDDCSYGMTAVRPIGCKDFNKTQHVYDVQAAKRYVDSILNEKTLASKCGDKKNEYINSDIDVNKFIEQRGDIG